jgi:hypothetical protein
MNPKEKCNIKDQGSENKEDRDPCVVRPDSIKRRGFLKEGGSNTILFDRIKQDLDTRLTEPYL